jgi:uncharacterized delta-60 repeat protein
MKKLIFLLFIALNLTAFSQQYSADATFNIGSGSDGWVATTAIQTDGKIILGGGFTSYNGTPVNNIVRVNVDGTVDPSFNSSGTGFNGDITSIDIQANGKIMVGGFFSGYNSISRRAIARINSDGTLDLSFDPGTGFIGDYGVTDLKIISNERILVGGDFWTYNGVPRNGVAIINSTGSLDNTFYPGLGMSGSQFGIQSVLEQPDGKIIAAGYITNFFGFSATNIVRINSDGSYDNTFSGYVGDAIIMDVKIQSDGKIVTVRQYDQNGIDQIARLNTDGTLDQTFNTNVGSGFIDADLRELKIQPDGKILVGGSFSEFNAIQRDGICRINPDGSLDNTFNPGTGLQGATAATINLQEDGKIILGGGFSVFNQTARNNICRLVSCIATTNQTIYPNVCAPYLSPTSQIYLESGVYNETIQSFYGCDSVYLTINLTILNSSSSFSDTICNGEIFIWNSQYYSTSGIFQQTLTNQFGCDSLVTLNLTVIPNNFNPTFSSTQQLYTAPPFAVQFSNSTANASNYSFVWYWGDGTSSSSNNASVFHEYLYNGQYTVSLIATDNVTGCSDTTTITDYIYCTGGASCTHTATISQQGPLQVCAGTDVWLSCNNDPSFTYQWRRNGINVPGNNNDSLLVTQSGNYTVSIYVNSCPVTSNGISVTINSLPNVPTITPTGTITFCSGGSLTLSAPAGLSSYSWNTGATSSNITVTQSGNYTVTVTNSNGCARNSAPYVVNASFMSSPNVCIVGMDSLTNENRIVWEKPITTGIDSFYVYKETNVSDVYTKIGATNYPDLAVFLDQNSNPAVQAYRYKLAVLDTCGTETPLSDFHKTIHLTINAGVGGAWNLIWSHYEGLTFGSYNIYRGTNPTNISLLTTIQSNLNSYTDLAPPVGPVYYQIEIVNPNSCDPAKVINYSVSKSNIVNNGVNGINALTNTSVLVYPNPTSKDVTLEITSELLGKDYYLTDNTGRIILSGQFRALKETINLEQIATGVYFIKIDDNANLMYKIVKN